MYAMCATIFEQARISEGKISNTVHVNVEHIAIRDAYLRRLLENRARPASELLREVYTDKSYVHQHHRSETLDLYLSGEKYELERLLTKVDAIVS